MSGDRYDAQDKYKAIIRNSISAVLLTDSDGAVLEANRAACSMFGYTADEIVTLNSRDLIDSEDPQLLGDKTLQTVSDETAGELTGVRKDGSKIRCEYSAVCFEDNGGGLLTSMILVDVTLCKQQERRLQYIVEHSTNLFYIHDTEGMLTYVSPKTREFFGVDPEVAMRHWTEFTTDHPSNTKAVEYTERALATGVPQPSYETQLRKSDGSLIWVRVHEAPVVEDGAVVSIAGSLSDITEMKLNRERLQESLERYNYLSMATYDAVWDWNLVDNTIYWGEGFKTLFGYEEGTVTETLSGWIERVHPEDRLRAEQSMRDIIEGSGQNWYQSYRFRKADGTFARVEDRGFLIRDEQGSPVRMIGAVRDVTERFELKSLLEQTNKMARIGSWEVDLTKKRVYRSPVTLEIYELGPDHEFDLESSIDFFKEEDHRERITRAVDEAIENGRPWDLELLMVTARGNELWVRSKGAAEIVEGKCVRIYGILQDIDERKKAQIQMQEAHEERRRILESVTVAFFAMDGESNVTYWNKQSEELTGVLRDDILGRSLWDAFPEAMNLRFYREYNRAVEEQKSVQFEEYFPPLELWVDVNAYPSEDGLSVFFWDISERKAAAAELKETNEKLAVAQQIAKLGYWEQNLESDELYWSDEVYRIFGMEKELFSPDTRTFEKAVHPEDLDYFSRELQRSLTGKQEHNVEYRIILPDKSVKWVHEIGSLKVNSEGRANRFAGTVQDITEKKLAEQEAERSRKLLEKLTDQAQAAVWIRNDEGRHIFVNQEFTSLFGLEKKQVVGKTLFDLFDRETAEQFQANDQQVLSSDSPKVFEERVATKRGDRYYQTNIFPLKGIPGLKNISGGVAIDITRQKEGEEVISNSLKEKETLLAEIHHRVKNNLALVSSLMELQSMNSENSELNDLLQEGVLRIKSIAGIHEQLYQSENFSSIRFSGEVRSLIENIVGTLQTATKMELQFDLEQVELSMNQGIPCSLLINEVVTNILKHAFRGRKSGRMITSLKEESGEVTLQIEDNGNGLPDDFHQKPHQSMGLELIDLLTQQLNGESDYSSTDSGTIFTLVFKKAGQTGSRDSTD